MLYKYLFYSASYVVKKYDRIWEVKDMYFAWGAGFVGAFIALTIMNIMDIVGIFIYRPMIWSNYKILIYLPITLGIISFIYFGYKRRCDIVYEEIKNMDKRKKKIYKILNITHILFTLSIYFLTGDIVRELNCHDGPSHAVYLIRVLGIEYM